MSLIKTNKCMQEQFSRVFEIPRYCSTHFSCFNRKFAPQLPATKSWSQGRWDRRSLGPCWSSSWVGTSGQRMDCEVWWGELSAAGHLGNTWVLVMVHMYPCVLTTILTTGQTLLNVTLFELTQIRTAVEVKGTHSDDLRSHILEGAQIIFSTTTVAGRSRVWQQKIPNAA